MITVSADAATQIKLSAEQGKAEGLALRLAIHQREDKSFHYVMGFDDKSMDGDKEIESEGVKLVVDNESQKLSAGLMVDFVEIEGSMQFVFMNPNDPSYRAPTED